MIVDDAETDIYLGPPPVLPRKYKNEVKFDLSPAFETTLNRISKTISKNKSSNGVLSQNSL